MASGTFFIYSLGCKANQYEEQLIREALIRNGFAESPATESDFVIINSCTVTALTDRKTRQAARKYKRLNPNGYVIVTGCMASEEDDIRELKNIIEIDEVIPFSEKLNIPARLARIAGVAVSSGPMKSITGFAGHTRAFLKIQDGCPQRCSYCKVSLVRNKVFFKDTKDILCELETLVDNGYPEIVLTGICMGVWKGGGGEGLDYLVRRICQVDKDFRIRLSSIEPNHVTSSLIRELAQADKFCEHLHLPLQSGSDAVLKSMGRNYTPDDFLRCIDDIRNAIARPAISLDVMVGYPSETEKDFHDTVRILKRIRPARIHVFRYSPRKGTAAYGMARKADDRAVRERAQELIALGRELQEIFGRSFVGEQVEVLLESGGNKRLTEGYTRRYVRFFTNEPVRGSVIKTLKASSFDPVKLCLSGRR